MLLIIQYFLIIVKIFPNRNPYLSLKTPDNGLKSSIININSLNISDGMVIALSLV